MATAVPVARPRAAPAAAAGAAPKQAARPRTAAQAAAAKNAAAGGDSYEAQLLAPTIRQYEGRLKGIGAEIVQVYVKQRGGRVRLIDFPASNVLAMVTGGADGDRFFVLESTGPTLAGLSHEGYHGSYTKFLDRKNQTVFVRSGSARVQSDKMAAG